MPVSRATVHAFMNEQPVTRRGDTEGTSMEARCKELMKSVPSSLRQFYYGSNSRPVRSQDYTEALVELLFEMSSPGEIRQELEKSAALEEQSATLIESDTAAKILEMERRIQRVFCAYEPLLPSGIWHCCPKCCISMIAVDSDEFLLFDELLRIHKVAEELHKRVEDCMELVATRRFGVGGSSLVHSGPSRSEREIEAGVSGTDLQRALRSLAAFVIDVLPFLYGLQDSPRGTRKPKRMLCTEAICFLLGVSKNFLYGKKRVQVLKIASETELKSIVDSSGVRLRQLRRRGDRGKFPPISELQQFQCGCDEP